MVKPISPIGNYMVGRMEVQSSLKLFSRLICLKNLGPWANKLRFKPVLLSDSEFVEVGQKVFRERKLFLRKILASPSLTINYISLLW